MRTNITVRHPSIRNALATTLVVSRSEKTHPRSEPIRVVIDHGVKMWNGGARAMATFMQLRLEDVIVKLEQEKIALQQDLARLDVTDDQVTNVADTLNAGFDSDDQYRFSTDQVRKALEHYVEDHIEHWMIGLEDEFTRLPCDDQDRLLGEPRVDLVEEARWDRADDAYDRMMDK